MKHYLLVLFLSAGAALRADVITGPFPGLTDQAINITTINGLNPLFYTVDIFSPPDEFGVSTGVNLAPQFVDFQWIIPTIPTPPTEPAPWPTGDFSQPQNPPPDNPPPDDPPPTNPGDPGDPGDPPAAGTPEPGTMFGCGFVLAVLARRRRAR